MDRSQDGLTLIELLVSVVILGIISTVMVQSLTVGLRTAEITERRIRSALDVGLVTAAMVPDVHTADRIFDVEELTLAEQVSACTDELLVAVRSSATLVTVYRVTNSGAERTLSLRRCGPGGTEDTPLATFAVDDTVTVSCWPGPTCDPAEEVTLEVIDDRGAFVAAFRVERNPSDRVFDSGTIAAARELRSCASEPLLFGVRSSAGDVVAYLAPPADDALLLVRRHCRDGAVVGQNELARELAADDPPVAHCDERPNCRAITLRVAPVDGDAATVTATRRAS